MWIVSLALRLVMLAVMAAPVVFVGALVPALLDTNEESQADKDSQVIAKALRPQGMFGDIETAALPYRLTCAASPCTSFFEVDLGTEEVSGKNRYVYTWLSPTTFVIRVESSGGYVVTRTVTDGEVALASGWTSDEAPTTTTAEPDPDAFHARVGGWLCDRLCDTNTWQSFEGGVEYIEEKL